MLNRTTVNFLIKTGKKKPEGLAGVYHFDLYGERSKKYKFLFNQSIQSIPFNHLPNTTPM
ncbi:adenine specific DNA methyltransferase [Mariprofundus ferrooxydans PV-1]|jgi:hypothetical protein|uniref:Adenine specific DNA methyltransferase n=1 Tax=Mariprofundus ferrooxydans PV-1 TaxID=314345 RepID=Q0F099_9PROT|nr:adenine specific DNA methyltransferase [Mariprofundus ferrooxydans PV-1]